MKRVRNITVAVVYTITLLVASSMTTMVILDDGLFPAADSGLPVISCSRGEEHRPWYEKDGDPERHAWCEACESEVMPTASK